MWASIKYTGLINLFGFDWPSVGMLDIASVVSCWLDCYSALWNLRNLGNITVAEQFLRNLVKRTGAFCAFV